MSLTSLQPLPVGSKAVVATQVLADLARRIGPGAKLPTVRVLCKQLQVSQSTLDAALNDLEIQGLLHRKHRNGVFVSPLARIRRIGLVLRHDPIGLGRGSDDFGRLLLSVLRSEGLRREAFLTVYDDDAEHVHEKYGPQQFELDVQNGRLDALIASGLPDTTHERLRALGVPCVYSVGGACPFAPRVCLNYNTMVVQGVRALVQDGRKRIALAYPVIPGTNPLNESFQLFQEAVRELGAAEDFRWLMPFESANLNLRPLEAARRFQQLWEGSAERPDALLSLDDHYTAGVLHAAETLGVPIPQDLLVVSHANKGLDLFNEVNVIRIEYDPADVARAILDTLDALLEGKQPTPVQLIAPRLSRWADKEVLPIARQRAVEVAGRDV